MLRALPTAVEPDRWTVAFHRTSPYWWVRLLAVGRYKHVSAFSYVPQCSMWVYFDVTLAGTKLILLPDSEAATLWIAERTHDADLVQVKSGSRRHPPIAPFYCVSALKSLIGLRSSALLPDGLFRDCVANGAEILDGTSRSQSRPDGCGAATAGSAARAG